jgi:hypothetical protein
LAAGWIQSNQEDISSGNSYVSYHSHSSSSNRVALASSRSPIDSKEAAASSPSRPWNCHGSNRKNTRRGVDFNLICQANLLKERLGKANATRVPNPDKLRPHGTPHLRRNHNLATSPAPAMVTAVLVNANLGGSAHDAFNVLRRIAETTEVTIVELNKIDLRCQSSRDAIAWTANDLT